jgi:hypothetical protein
MPSPHPTARIHTSRSSSVVKITGIAFGWIGATIALGTVVKKPWWEIKRRAPAGM